MPDERSTKRNKKKGGGRGDNSIQTPTRRNKGEQGESTVPACMLREPKETIDADPKNVHNSGLRNRFQGNNFS